MLADEDIGLVEKVFGYQTRISHELFIESLKGANAEFLRPSSIRCMVRQHLTELLVNRD